MDQGKFDQEVAAYDRARPSYPDALFDDLIAYLGNNDLSIPFDAVEIGPGTGKATASLLARGSRVTAVEHGAAMAAFLAAGAASASAQSVTLYCSADEAWCAPSWPRAI